MAPVEPARAAAVAVAATAGVILVALAVAKFKSNNKKHSSEKTDGPETELRTTPQRKVIVPGSQIPTDGAIQQSNGVSQTEVKVTQNGKSKGSTVKSSARQEPPPAQNVLKSSPEPAVERKTVPKPAPRSVKTSRKGKVDSQQDTANSNLEAKPCLETEIKADSSDTPLLVKQVYKPDDEQGEQTLVSFAEIRFSPRSSPEKSSPSASAGSKTVSVVQKGAHSQEKGEVTSPRRSLNSSTNSSFESSSRAVDGAGESLAQIPQTADDSAIGDISGSFPSDASGDASFVLLDVATAPSNCKPDKDIVESAELDRSELSKSVSLQRLKSSGSDSGVGETTPAPDSPDAVDSDPYPGLSDEDIRETLSLAAGRPESLEMRHALTLVKMLSTRDVELQEKLLSVISKVAAFSKSQNNLRQAGCIPRLIHLLRIQRQALAGGVLPPLDFTNALINAVTNLAVNTTNNSLMQECVPPLSDLTLSSGVPDSVRMSSLQALTNLSVTTDHHGHMTRLVQPLYSLVDSPVPSIQLQALKVLVNLSCNKDMVPNLLASKPPNCLLFLLEPKASESLVLRWTTVLGNIMHTVRERQMSSSQLPPVDKAASPETMYSALYGLNSSGHLRNKVFVLSRHPNEDIRYQAARIYSGLTKHSTV